MSETKVSAVLRVSYAGQSVHPVFEIPLDERTEPVERYVQVRVQFQGGTYVGRAFLEQESPRPEERASKR